MWLRRILIVLSVLCLLMTYTGIICITSGESMLPTLNNGDLLIVVKSKDYDYNDIVILNKGKTLVKRIVGKSEDILYLDENYHIIRNNTLVNEPYVIVDSQNGNHTEYTVSQGSYFVLGDNRNNSRDSRDFGSITKSDIKGKVIINLTESLGIKLWHFRMFQILLVIGLIILSIDWRKYNAGKIKWNSSKKVSEVEDLQE